VRDGDLILVDAEHGRLEAEVDARTWNAREPATADLSACHHGLGRELFAGFRAHALGAEQGAVTFYAPEAEAAPRDAACAPPVHAHFAYAKEGAA
jgi:phosphogluconate dehydratase